MVKRALKVVLTFGLLVAAHVGYREGFALLVRLLPRESRVPILPYSSSPSRTARETQSLAEQAFGPGHWTTRPNDHFTYYDAERGYWLFFQRYTRTKGGKRIEFAPFALIWRSRDKANLNTVLANTAAIDFDKPLELGKQNGEPAKVVHAVIEGEVKLRDDKGTLAAHDDFTIGPMTRVEYDEPKNQVLTDSEIEIHETDLVATAVGATLYLRPREPAAPGAKLGSGVGFTGVKSIVLKQKVRIVSENVGKIGIVPGGKELDANAAATQKRLGEIVCDGPAQIDLPQPRPRPANPRANAKAIANANAKVKAEPATPPSPPEPVLAKFERNVVVRQSQPAVNGVVPPPDQLNADALLLTLVPKADVEENTEKANNKSASAKDGSAADAQPLSGLTLKVAEATGHAVWLQSPAQGLEARGNQLIFEKLAPAKPDVIYFRGDRETRVEKVNRVTRGPDRGKVGSIDTIRTIDVTVYQPLKLGDAPTVIARGPGSMETRPSRDLPVERSATWGDRLVYQTIGTATGPQPRIVLTGGPSVQSANQGGIAARDRLIAYLRPKAGAKPKSANAGAGALSAAAFEGDALQIDWVEALGKVELTTTNNPSQSQVVRVRDRLDVVFAHGDDPEPAPTNINTDGDPRPSAVEAVAADAKPEPGPAPKPKPAQPPIRVDANSAWARVQLTPGRRDRKPELQEVRLRGRVVLHQDAPPGKLKGTHVTAEAIDLKNRGDGLAWFEAHGKEGENQPPAHIESDNLTIEGPRIGLDQAEDFAWVKGPGLLRQDPRPRTLRPDQAERDDVKKTVAFHADPVNTGKDGDPTDVMAKSLSANGPVEIVWTQEMQFFGQGQNDKISKGRGTAVFLGGVKVTTPDSGITCGKLNAFLDGPVSFQRPLLTPDSQKRDTPRPAPRIVMVHAYQAVDPEIKRPLAPVDLVHRKADPETGAFQQKGRVTGPRLGYDLTTGEFLVDGAGTVWLYRPKGEGQGGPHGIPGFGPRPANPAARGGEAILRPTSANRPVNAAKAGGETPIIELTRVSFQRKVSGRVGNGDGSAANGARPLGDAPFFATFAGGVQVLNGPVADDQTDLDADDPPSGYMMLTSDELKVVREAPSRRAIREAAANAGANANAPNLVEQFFIDATGDPQAVAPPKAIKGDRITYDSMKELVYVYGDDGGVTIRNQDGIGQPYSTARGKAVMFNRKSNEIKIIDPKNALLIDPRSGIRSRPAPPSAATPPAAPESAPRRPIRNIPRNDKERAGFTSR